MSGVDKEQLMRYIELEKQIQNLETQNALKNYEVKKKAAEDVALTIQEVENTLKQLNIQTKKEKDDVDKMMKNKSIGDIFKTQADYDSQLSQEQEEYLEALNKEEVCKQHFTDLQKQHQDLEREANVLLKDADVLKKLYEERDGLLSDIFGGEYGSVEENKLEAKFDELMDKKQRVSVANYKWTNARVLLQHAVNQLAHAVRKWSDLDRIPPHETTIKYCCATEARNNNIAACSNVKSCHKYLGDKIDFPYLKPNEIETLERATANIYTDMLTPSRCKHAFQCYDITWKRATALLQWFDNVIQGTIQKDLKKVTEEVKKVEKDLRAERIKLIRDKVAESGGDVGGLTDAEMMPGLKGLTDGFSQADQQKLSDDDMDLKGIGIVRAAPVGDDGNMPDASNDRPMPAPTPLPLSELAPLPCEDDLFGDISQLKEQYKKDREEFERQQGLNKIRQEQGLQEKLAARRHKKKC
ncbi:uncharacterized protein LOC132732000 isoform X5 [Ruditapes philippinarum]|uniref:uncharacterized protein LOC132732000 isoform X5 n=1 Tax=Ruditapes philippinarum TaxID=129788 RepID=UPI00295B418F|nr:uncharacterized protein LOC132732000 isoform X5 [Ruditapes philippinarum]